MIQTNSGEMFNPFEPDPSKIKIEDIAYGLSMICRYNGHCREFYSVAQHSVLVMQHTSPSVDSRLAGLLHDSPEAYIGDLIGPIKDRIPAFQELENILWTAIAKKFDISIELPASVMMADRRALVTEKRDLIPVQLDWIGINGVEPFARIIEPWSSAIARQKFLAAYYALSDRKNSKEGK